MQGKQSPPGSQSDKVSEGQQERLLQTHQQQEKDQGDEVEDMETKDVKKAKITDDFFYLSFVGKNSLQESQVVETEEKPELRNICFQWRLIRSGST